VKGFAGPVSNCFLHSCFSRVSGASVRIRISVRTGVCMTLPNHYLFPGHSSRLDAIFVVAAVLKLMLHKLSSAARNQCWFLVSVYGRPM